ncbi:MAG TPA: SPOR domain-containing protein [Stellaceae bacterium]
MSIDQVHHAGERRPRLSQPARRKRNRVWMVVGLSLAFVALIWAWAFQRAPGAQGIDVPVLTADHQPTRERPSDPGGMKVPDIDPLAYDPGRVAPRIENILPAPDQPLPQPAPDRQLAAATPPASSGGAAAPGDEAAPSDHVADAAGVGQPVRLVPDVPPRKPVPTKSAQTTPRRAKVPPLAAVKPLPKPKPAAARIEAKPRPAATRAPEMGGSYRLQLASLRSDGDARAVEARLRRSYGDLLGAVGFSVVAVNLGERGTYYRVMAGPMGQGSAAHLCDALRGRGAACILAKP